MGDEISIVDYAAALWADGLILAHVEVSSPRLTEQVRTHQALRSLRHGDLAAFTYAMLASDETHYVPRIEMERCGQVIEFRADLATARADLNSVEQVLAIAHGLDDLDVRLDETTAILTFDLEALDLMKIAISIGALVAAIAPHEGFVAHPVRVQAPTDDRLIDLAGDWDTGRAPWRLPPPPRDVDTA